MKKMIQKSIVFLRKETVLCIAILFALLSMFLVRPTMDYVHYIDWNTLTLLFSLMAVIKGFQKAGLFTYLGGQLLSKTHSSKKMLFVLVGLPFLFSMVITNDVSLITFVPFGLTVLRMAKQEHLAVPLVIMQTIDANMGSTLTPMGNPQNLYLYTKSGMSFGGLFWLMLPYVAISGILLAVLIGLKKSQPICNVSLDSALQKDRHLFYYAIGLLLCLLSIFKILPAFLVAAIIAVFLLVTDRQVLKKVDYSLLGTFFALFIFIGNIGKIEIFQDFLSATVSNHVESISILSSQIISNVPAALLLSGFTNQWNALIVGCNLGGLGTLIASMASLISYKSLAKEYPHLRKKYILHFTLYNVCFLVLLILANLLLRRCY